MEINLRTFGENKFLIWYKTQKNATVIILYVVESWLQGYYESHVQQRHAISSKQTYKSN